MPTDENQAAIEILERWRKDPALASLGPDWSGPHHGPAPRDVVTPNGAIEPTAWRVCLAVNSGKCQVFGTTMADALGNAAAVVQVDPKLEAHRPEGESS